MHPPIPFLPLRDPVSALTHLFAAVFALFATALLWRLSRGDWRKRFSLACFGVAMVLLYSASGIYHAVLMPKTSDTVQALRRLDHSAIYVLIAGTYTPTFAVLLGGRVRAVMLGLVWALAAVGIAMKWTFSIAPEIVTVGLYLALGWLAVLPAAALIRAGGWGMLWGLAGGLCYTAGAVCELMKWPVIIPGLVRWHEVFHVLDMAGTACHVVFMVRCVVPYDPKCLMRPAVGRA